MLPDKPPSTIRAAEVKLTEVVCPAHALEVQQYAIARRLSPCEFLLSGSRSTAGASTQAKLADPWQPASAALLPKQSGTDQDHSSDPTFATASPGIPACSATRWAHQVAASAETQYPQNPRSSRWMISSVQRAVARMLPPPVGRPAPSGLMSQGLRTRSSSVSACCVK